MTDPILALIDALAALAVEEYLAEKAAPGNDPAPERSERVLPQDREAA